MKTHAKHRVIKGTLIAGGIVIGRTRVVLPGDTQIAEMTVPAAGVAGQIRALDRAIEETVSELSELRQSAIKKMGGPVAKIFDAQLLIADDKEFLSIVKEDIKVRRRNAAYVYNLHVTKATAPLKNSADAYIQQMAQDIEAVAGRVVAHLSGNNRRSPRFAPNTVLVGRSFTPGEVLTYRQQKVIGFVVTEGGPNSHMALIARALYLPVILIKDLPLTEIGIGQDVILDGVNGNVILNPTRDECSEYQQRRKKLGPALITRIKRLKRIPPETRDGAKVPIAANLTLPGPAEDILSERKIPVGLYRSEFLYLSQNRFPDEQTQFEHYDHIAQKFADSSVVIRTFDLGYDKLADDGIWPQEDNPALGWRGIRPMLDMSKVFKEQIRAILRASTRKNLKILLPMISDITEFDKSKRFISQVKFDLKRSGIPFDEGIQVGIMVEVPAVVLMAEELFPKADFVSIGTNDLTQYTLAADRKNIRVANLYSSFHPAVLQLIGKTVEVARKHDRPVSICGEMAGDLLALPLFIGLKIDLLSMSPNRIVDLCRMVKKIDSELVNPLVKAVMSSSTTSSVINKLESFKNALGSTRQRKQ